MDYELEEFLQDAIRLKKNIRDDIESPDLDKAFDEKLDRLIERMPVRKAIRPDVGPGLNYRSRGPFPTFGDQLSAIINAGTPGQEPDKRLYQVRSAMGLSETVPSDSGFLVQTDFSNRLLEGVDTQAILKPMCINFPISGNANGIKINAFAETSRVSGSRWGGARCYWLAEAQEKTASKPTFRQLELSLKKLVGLVYFTDETMQDIPTLERILTRAFVNEIAYESDWAILNGSGVGQPLGILASGSKVTVTRNTANQIRSEDIFSMWSRLIGGAHKNSCWLINQDTIPSLYGMVLGSGTEPVYLPAGSVAGQPFPTLLGRPVYIIEQCPSLGTSGDIILGSFSDGYLWADKGGLRSDISIHVRFVHDEQVMRLVYRCDGQPVLSQPVTPASGSASKVSHFVVLS